MIGRDGTVSRREFFRMLAAATAGVLFVPPGFGYSKGSVIPLLQPIAVSRNGSPPHNLEKVLELLGGIGSFVGGDDIVVIKPNCQWRNQGTTNIACVRRLIELILALPGFNGEIIVAENIHRTPADSEGWTVVNEINYDTEKGLRNYNELVAWFHDAGYAQVTKCHLVSTDRGGRIVTGPADGDGYVHTNLVYTSVTGDSTIMTYPVFTSSFSGITIDFRSGAWKHGAYLNRHVRFINTSVLNDHGSVNATCSVKNLMGVVDLPGNEFGELPGGYKNFHSILTRGMGGALGMFMNSIRRPDLNIITAEWVGWGSRIDPAQATRARTVLASTDPVALDYWATKYVLYPCTPEGHPEKEYHHPDNDFTHLWKYLHTCNDEGIGTLNENEMQVSEFDFNAGVDSGNCRYITGDAAIYYNYPNPFNAWTTLRFDLVRPASVSVTIYDAAGRQVRSLLAARQLPSGPHLLTWDGRDRTGRRVAGGVYVCRFIIGGSSYYIKLAASQ